MSFPEMLGAFRIVRRIGSGGMAEVFLAERHGAEGTSKRVVVKRILPDQRRDPRHHAMFVREARIATALDHPNIVHVHELVDHPTDGLLLAMEYVDGADLATVLGAVKRRGERVPPYVAALIVREAAKGLHHAHEQRGADGAPLEIVHRDVSPQNILLSRAGGVKIADLGVATGRLYRDATVGVKGKLRYMAPEQAEGAAVDRRADVYALGVVLYEALRLVSPYGVRDDAALLRAVQAGRFEPPLAAVNDVPADLLAIVTRALAPDPADRFPTARDIAAALAQAIASTRSIVDETAVEALVTAAVAARVDVEPIAGTATVVTAAAARRALDKPMRAEGRPLAAMLAPGATVGRYVIDEQLGRGGMADVYGARDTTLDRRVALKILRGVSGDDARRRLLREAKLAAGFAHPGSVVIYDVGEAAGVGFIAMELVSGVPLSELVRDPDVPLGRRLRWLVATARVLAAAHEAGLVHRDVKPNNLMIRDGGDVKVLDFGIARATVPARDGEPSTSSGAFVGTLRYAAPECFAGLPIDGRADQFSWGITAWELLAGRHPFDREDALDAVGRGLFDGVGSFAEAAPDVPPEVARVVDRAVSKRPEDRFPSLDDAAEALEPFAEPRPFRAAPRDAAAPIAKRGGDSSAGMTPTAVASPPRADAPAPRRGRLARALLLAAGLLAVPVALLTLRGDARKAAPPPAAVPVKMVDGIACTDAVVEGAGIDLARALGRGACARLASEIAVSWDVPAGQPLEVRAKVVGPVATITLRIADREATATAEALMPAVWRAIEALAPQLVTPAWSAERIRLWGARDEASGRRMQRVWQRSGLNVRSDIASQIKRLIETDGDSPMPHLFALMTSSGGAEAIDAAPKRIEERLHRVPPARAMTLRALLLVFPVEHDRKEGTRLFREAYAAAPDDLQMVALYASIAARVGLPEAPALAERLHDTMPPLSVPALSETVWRGAHRDEVRNVHYVTWIDEILPEASARIPSVSFLASIGRFEEARAAIDRARRLGISGSTADPLFFAGASAELDLAMLDPAAGRAHGNTLLADPRFAAGVRGGLLLVASYLQEGQFAEAARGMRQQADRQRDQGNLPEVASFALPALRLARWLDKRADPAHVALLERILAERNDTPVDVRTSIRIELALARRDGAPTPAAMRDELRALEEAAGHDADSDPLVREGALCPTVPLVRAVRGNRAAVALFRETTHAPYVVRRAAAVDAALAFEAIGDDDGAEAAYRLAADPSNNAEEAVDRVLALARLARLHHRRGHGDDILGQEEKLDRLWARADAGLREAVQRMH